MSPLPIRKLLITGAAGAVGQALLDDLAQIPADKRPVIIATDIRPPVRMPEGALYRALDVRGGDAERVLEAERPDVVVHLASIVTPSKDSSREFEYAVDVTGTQNVLAACVRHQVRRVVVTSSGAAYGYHADNPDWLTEEHPVRGNPEFAYAHHKRLVEEQLLALRQAAPQLEQVILRVGTVLGAGVENQITALFRRKRLLAIRGARSAFVFIWTRDLARILLRAATDGPPGIFNVAGDGVMDVDDLARVLRKPVLRLPAGLLRFALTLAKPLKLSRYGPEQVGFLQYRPVLDNTRLKTVFGYVPEKTSAEAFAIWQGSAGL